MGKKTKKITVRLAEAAAMCITRGVDQFTFLQMCEVVWKDTDKLRQNDYETFQTFTEGHRYDELIERSD